MTLRDTIRSILQKCLDWAKANRDYFGNIKAEKERELEAQKWLNEYHKKQKAEKAEMATSGNSDKE